MGKAYDAAIPGVRLPYTEEEPRRREEWKDARSERWEKSEKRKNKKRKKT